ncbi:metalloproteinase [Aphelenchoides avenae]|nr:metalloproteinase [Aphelenchus avenae]
MRGKKQYAWLEKYAEQQQKKKPNVPKTPEKLKKEAKELESHGANNTAKIRTPVPTIPNVNKPIADLLFEGDILLTERDAKELGLVGNSTRRRRSAESDPERKWPTDKPIPYYFDASLDEQTRELIRYSLNWWKEHSCLEWKENAEGTPKVKFFSEDGCYSLPGRIYWEDEQEISIAHGCEYFATVTHEAAHAMGLYHEMARPDRDKFIQLVTENIGPGWDTQYKVESESLIYDTSYDYGSNMQYSGYEGEKIVMMAKEKAYQHTMGNEVGPLFQDIRLLNEHYKCFDKCTSSKCQNGGFPNPRDCNKCICPDGFAGDDCSERAKGVNGAPETCGQTVEWQTLSGSVLAGPEQGKWKLALRHACCYFHIKAPPGKKVQIKMDKIVGKCHNNCYFGATEVKYGNLVRGGVRMCCPEHAQELGPVTSKQELAIVSVCAQSTDAEGEKAQCEDKHSNCPKIAAYCQNSAHSTVMKLNCRKTCKVC